MQQMQAITQTGSQKGIILSALPDECPICHKKVTPNFGQAFLKTGEYDAESLQVIFRCPNESCMNIFIGYYYYINDNIHARYEYSKPNRPIDQVFSDMITSSFPNFVKIYNQAYTAEQSDLDIICGAGYRKALEFLIKDYLIAKNPQETEKITKEFLGSLVETRVEHPQLKAVVKRAVWLGNDETHYERIWEDKDVTDLKKTIDLAIRWIEADKLTEDLLNDMPGSK